MHLTLRALFFAHNNHHEFSPGTETMVMDNGQRFVSNQYTIISTSIGFFLSHKFPQIVQRTLGLNMNQK